MSVGEVFMLCRGKNRAAGALTVQKERCGMGIYLNPGNNGTYLQDHADDKVKTEKDEIAEIVETEYRRA